MHGKWLAITTAFACLSIGWGTSSLAQVPSCINYQGRIIREGTNFNGVAQFKFKLLNADGTTSCWSNDGSTGGGAEPTLAVPIAVTRGLFYARLGDTNLTNMVAMTPAVFTNTDIRLRIWVDSGAGFELITPDQMMASVGYAMMSANIEDGIVTPEKLAAESRALFVATDGGNISGSLSISSNLYLTGTSQLIFPDATTQTTAFVQSRTYSLASGECDTNRLDVLFSTSYRISSVRVWQSTALPQEVRLYTNGVQVDAFGLTSTTASRTTALDLAMFDRLGIACTNTGGTVLFCFEGYRQ